MLSDNDLITARTLVAKIVENHPRRLEYVDGDERMAVLGREESSLGEYIRGTVIPKVSGHFPHLSSATLTSLIAISYLAKDVNPMPAAAIRRFINLAASPSLRPSQIVDAAIAFGNGWRNDQGDVPWALAFQELSYVFAQQLTYCCSLVSDKVTGVKFLLKKGTRKYRSNLLSASHYGSALLFARCVPPDFEKCGRFVGAGLRWDPREVEFFQLTDRCIYGPMLKSAFPRWNQIAANSFCYGLGYSLLKAAEFQIPLEHSDRVAVALCVNCGARLPCFLNGSGLRVEWDWNGHACKETSRDSVFIARPGIYLPSLYSHVDFFGFFGSRNNEGKRSKPKCYAPVAQLRNSDRLVHPVLKDLTKSRRKSSLLVRLASDDRWE